MRDWLSWQRLILGILGGIRGSTSGGLRFDTRIQFVVHEPAPARYPDQRCVGLTFWSAGSFSPLLARRFFSFAAVPAPADSLTGERWRSAMMSWQTSTTTQRQTETMAGDSSPRSCETMVLHSRRKLKAPRK